MGARKGRKTYKWTFAALRNQINIIETDPDDE
jgi:hypothetical protein